jgi:hypothetical protein
VTITGDKLVNEWIIKTGESVKSVDELHKSIRKEQAQEKKLDLIRKELDKTTGKVTDSTKGLTKVTSGLSTMLGNVMFAALRKVTGAMGDMIQTARDHEDWIGKNTKALQGMREASAGMINDLDLMKARTKLTTGDLKLTEGQLNAVTKAAIHFTRVNKTTFQASLEKITRTIQTGSSKAIKELGFQVDLLGKQHVKSADAVKMITERFGGMQVEASNTNERIDQMKTAFSNIVGSIGSAILQSDAFTRALKSLSDMAAEITAGYAHAADPRVQRQVALTARRRAIRGMLEAKGIGAKAAAAGRAGVSMAEGARLAAMNREQLQLALKIAEAEAITLARKRNVTSELQKHVKHVGEIVSAATARPGRTTVGRGGRGARGAPGVSAEGMDIPGGLMSVLGIPSAEDVKSELNIIKEALGEGFSSILPIGDSNRMADAARSTIASFKSMTDAAENFHQTLKSNIIDEFNAKITGLAEQGLTAVATGMLGAADAAIQGSDNFGVAVLKMIKSVTMGLAGQLIGHAIHAKIMATTTATNPFTAWQSPIWAAQAVQYGIGAGVVSALGLGLSYGLSKTGGGGGGGAAAAPTTAGPTQTFGTPRQQGQQTQVFNVYLGDEDSPSAQWHRSVTAKRAQDRV